MEPDLRKHRCERRNKKVAVLENAEHKQITSERKPQPAKLYFLLSGPLDGLGRIVIDDDGEGKQEQEPPIPPGIEEEAGHEQKPVLAFEWQQVIADKDDRQENGERKAVKNHETGDEQSCGTLLNLQIAQVVPNPEGISL